MIEADSAKELMFADVALAKGANARDVAAALDRFQETPVGTRVPIGGSLEAAGAISQELREAVALEVERLIADADGDAAVALARRGGIDRSIHTSLAPATSDALIRDGAGARAPLRVIEPDRYQDFTLISQGGMGVVYMALDTELNRRVAFKMVRPDPRAPKDSPAPDTPLSVTPPSIDLAADASRSFEELKIRFLQEAWVTGAMEHPGVVPVYELGKTDAGIPYYTMRYVKGERTLATAIKEADDLDARLALLEPFLKICDTVRYAHARGVMHRDLKPENVALGEFGEAVVLDWGLSKMTERPDISGSMWRSRIDEYRDATDLHTVAGALGTPGYMAPEAALGKSEEVDAQSDIYSLGAVLYETLTGRLPYQFKTFMDYVQKTLEEAPPPAHEIAAGVPRELSDACARALARRKEDRFESVDELASVVRRWQTEGRLQQQIDELVGSARAALRTARELTGNMMLWHLDRASEACARVLHLKKDHGDAVALKAEIKQQREEGIKKRVTAGRRKLILAAGFLILATATIVTLVVANTLAEQRREAEARLQTERERGEAKTIEAKAARRDMQEAVQSKADLHAAFSGELLRQDRIAAARLAAALALTVAPTPSAWRALAAAQARWAPNVVALFGDVTPGPIAFAADGKRLFVCSTNGVQEIEVASGKVVREYVSEPVRLLVLSPDGSRMATTGKASGIQVWDTAGGTLLTTLDSKKPLGESVGPPLSNPGHVTAAAFSPDNAHLFTGHLAGAVFSWDLERGACQVGVPGASGTSVTALRVSGNGEYLFSGDWSGTISRSRVDKLTNSDLYETEKGRILHLAGPDHGESVQACTSEHGVLTFDVDPAEVFTLYQGRSAGLVAALPSPDARRLYTVSKEGTVEVWSTEQDGHIAVIEGPAKTEDAALSPSGSRLAVRAGKLVYVFALDESWRVGEREPITAIAASADGKRIWVARPDHSIELRYERGFERWYAHTATITALATDGEHAFSASLDGTIKVWRPRQMKPAVSFLGPASPTALATGASGQLHVGTIDGFVELWSWRRQRRITRLRGSGELPLVALAMAGRLLHGLDSSGTHRAWDLKTRELVDAEPVARPALPTKLPPIHGERLDWIRKDSKRRLIAFENRSALKIDGVAVVPVSVEEYKPHKPRVFPWSK